MGILLKDEEIHEIDIECGLSEINNSEPYYPLKYEHNLLRAQLNKIVEEGEAFRKRYPNKEVAAIWDFWKTLKKEAGK